MCAKPASAVRTNRQRRPFDCMSSKPPVLLAVGRTQLRHVDRQLPHEQLKDFTLQHPVPERDPGQITAVDRLGDTPDLSGLPLAVTLATTSMFPPR